MRVEIESLVGRHEIAEILGVEIDTVKHWRLRGLLPEPLAVISDTHLWKRKDIERWARSRPRSKAA